MTQSVSDVILQKFQVENRPATLTACPSPKQATFLVPQQGPVCAAASVAGALNMLYDTPMGKKGACKFQNTMAVHPCLQC